MIQIRTVQRIQFHALILVKPLDQTQLVCHLVLLLLAARVGACGGNYSSPSGVIYSPDFPDKYSPGRVCYWTIHVPGSSAILFNFTFFDISDQTDMVELLDGYTNQVVARFDWRSPPREVLNVTGDFVILYFYSDRTNQAQGFALLYQGEAGFEFQDFSSPTSPGPTTRCTCTLLALLHGSGIHPSCWRWTLLSFPLLVNASQPRVIRHI